MNISGWIQLAFYVLVLLAITKPLGLYLVQVLDANGKTFLDPVVRPIERLTYRILGVKPDREQNWIQYAAALLIFSVVSMIFTYGILRLQDHLPLNPQKFPAVADHLSFNTAASFTTNTNWQSYSGESTMSQFSQKVALALHNFLSAAAGVAVAAVIVRGISRHSSKTLGNFWVDVTRVISYLLLPICVVYALFLVAQAVPQNFRHTTTAPVVEAQTARPPTKDNAANPAH